MSLCRYLASPHLPGVIRGASLDVESDHTGLRRTGLLCWVPLFICASRRAHCITPPDLPPVAGGVQNSVGSLLRRSASQSAPYVLFSEHWLLGYTGRKPLEPSTYCFHDEPGGSFPTKPHHTFRNLGCALDPSFLSFSLSS